MPQKTNNIIEINGREYDADTGALLSGPPPKPKPRPAIKPVNRAKPAAHRQPAKHAASHKPATSRTLMRHTVNKPDVKPKPAFKAHGHTDALAKSQAELSVKASARRIDHNRLRRAKRVPKSQAVRRFSTSLARTSAATLPAALPAQPKPASAHRPAAMTPPRQTTRRPKTTSELLEHAVNQANSHAQPAPRQPAHKRSQAKRNLGIIGIICLTFLVMGVIFVQNVSDVRLQMAAAKADFSANLPNYSPAGYHLGPVDYGEGLITARFEGPGDHYYTVTEKRSDWDNSTLLNTVVRPTDTGYRVAEANDQVVYMYGHRVASWLDRGVWYQIKASGPLSDDQLLDIVRSL